MKIVKRLTLIIIIMTISISFSQNEVFASELSETAKLVCPEGSTTASGCGTSTTLAKKIETVVKTLSGLVGAFAVGMIVYGGFKYITSQGDPRQAETAKNIIWYAGVGLFIVLVAFIIFELLAGAMR